jgi:glycosyltransferase involved in cell wall biosynthesis
VSAASVHVVCVCPVKDESAQLDRFLSAASLWASHVIIADQGSTDQSVEIALRYPKVRVIRNDGRDYNEQARQRLLIDAARQVGGPRVIVALDADELLSANVLASEEWLRALAAPPGTAILFDWFNLLPDMRRGWRASTGLPWAYVDDGREHVGPPIHSPRVPWDESCPRIVMGDVKVLHYQYADWDLMKRKQMWYQCWETIHSSDLRPIDLYRRYHHMDALNPGDIIEAPVEWFSAYETAGIAVRHVEILPTDKWDHRILDLLLEHGPRQFRTVDLWSVDWQTRLRHLRPDQAGAAAKLADPRRVLDRVMLSWLRRSQSNEHRAVSEKVLRRLARLWGW